MLAPSGGRTGPYILGLTVERFVRKGDDRSGSMYPWRPGREPAMYARARLKRMVTHPIRRGRRAAWLLIPLLVLAAGGRSVCWCTDEESHCAESGSEATELVLGHEHERPGDDRSHQTQHQSSVRGSPSHDCCCIDTEIPVAPAPEGLAFDHLVGLAYVAARTVDALPMPREVRTTAVRLRPPKDSAPPLFVMHCSFLC